MATVPPLSGQPSGETHNSAGYLIARVTFGPLGTGVITKYEAIGYRQNYYEAQDYADSVAAQDGSVKEVILVHGCSYMVDKR